MLSFGFTPLLCYFVALVYPTWESFKAIGTAAKADDTQWLTYWVVYNLLTTLEYLLMGLFSYVPLYYEAKVLFIIWLIAPQTKGAQLLFETIVRPFLVQYASKIDPIFKTTQQGINSDMTNQIIRLAQTYGGDVANDALRMATDLAAKQAQQGKPGQGTQQQQQSQYQQPHSQYHQPQQQYQQPQQRYQQGSSQYSHQGSGNPYSHSQQNQYY
ncbi:hypothetical protein WJX74_008966 [Apatococcus lobatus]|uniref:HVA22-like protein n=1 Tax=Apatococcus lobatus TaxID=904363 RepID=A0AAW1QWG1_9CHLO